MHNSKYDELEGYEAEQTSLDDLKVEYAAYKAETDKTIAEKDNWIEKTKKSLAKNHIDI